MGSAIALEDAAGDQLGQPVGQDVAGDSQPGLEFLEMLEAVERAAEDQERPFLADQLDRRRNRAVQRRFPERVDSGRDSIMPPISCSLSRIRMKAQALRINSCN